MTKDAKTLTSRDKQVSSPSNLVGLLPAGGKAKRIAPLPCSKEVYPVGFHEIQGDLALRPKVVSHYLLEKMKLAGVDKAYIILRKEKWDIPLYYKDGKFTGIHLAYLIMDSPFGVPYTLDQAYPFIQNSTVLFGFPDILFQPDNAFLQLLEHQAVTDSDVVLGLFNAHEFHKVDMVERDDKGRVLGIEIKPIETKLCYAWMIAVWNSNFTQYIHDYIKSEQRFKIKDKTNSSIQKKPEIFLGDVIQAAIQDNLKINSVLFTNGEYLDIGTPEDLVKTFQSNNSNHQVFWK